VGSLADRLGLLYRNTCTLAACAEKKEEMEKSEICEMEVQYPVHEEHCSRMERTKHLDPCTESTVSTMSLTLVT
jgi:hypothetical protein